MVMNACRRHRRRGFTLVELLVVMGVMMFLAAIAVYMLPRMQENVKVSRAAQLLQSWLLNAKQRAKSSQLPTGVRLIYDSGLVTDTATHPAGLYIQAPGNWSAGGQISATL